MCSETFLPPTQFIQALKENRSTELNKSARFIMTRPYKFGVKTSGKLPNALRRE